MHVDAPGSTCWGHSGWACKSPPHLLEAVRSGLCGVALVLVWVQLKRELAVCSNTYGACSGY